MDLQEGLVEKWFQHLFCHISLEWEEQESELLKYEAFVLTNLSSTFLFLKKTPYFLL